MDWHSTPVYIPNYNNLDRGFRQLLAWLDRAGMRMVTVLDNHSTYPPLVDFYASNSLVIIPFDRNHGPYVLWDNGLAPQHSRFIVADPDTVPSPDCPLDLVARMHAILDADEAVVKVGPSLRIDNIPDHYARKEKVLQWEKQFWIRQSLQWPAYDAQLDTTFALYREGSSPWPGGCHLRLAPPLSAEHLPWYEDSAHPSAEREFYHQHAKPKWTNW